MRGDSNISTEYEPESRSGLSQTHLTALINIYLSKTTTETSDPKPAVDLWMEEANLRPNQRLRGASSSSRMQEAEEEDGGEDYVEDSEEDWVY